MNRPTRPRTLRTRMFSCRLPALLLVIAALGIVFAGNAQATTTIDPGFNLFHTRPDTFFFFGPPVPNPQFVNFEGVPLDLFDFGDGNGLVFVGDTDTIVERLQPANLGPSDTIDIELVALQLVSTGPVDLGFGAGFEDIFIDLNTSSPSFQSTMTITDTSEGQPHGTFDSTLNFSFDVTGSVGGFYATLEKTITATDQDWQHEPTGSMLIDGINHRLNTLDETNDFWPIDFVIHDDGTGTAIHTARAANFPEPSSLTLLALGGLMITRLRRHTW